MLQLYLYFTDLVLLHGEAGSLDEIVIIAAVGLGLAVFFLTRWVGKGGENDDAEGDGS